MPSETNIMDMLLTSKLQCARKNGREIDRKQFILVRRSMKRKSTQGEEGQTTCGTRDSYRKEARK